MPLRLLRTTSRFLQSRLCDRSIRDQDAPIRPRIVFFARVSDLHLLDLLEFYAEDIRALEALGFEVLRTNSIKTAATCRGEALFAWWWHSSLPAIIVWRLRRRPVVATGVTHLSENHVGRTFRDILRLALTIVGTRLSSANIAISISEWRDLRRIRAPHVQFLPCCVDADYYRPSVKSVQPTAVIVAQLNPGSIRRKGVDVAIKAAGELSNRLADFRLSIVGPSTSEGEVQIRLLLTESRCSNIRIEGELTRSAKRDLLSQAWFYLQPSTYEGFGLAVLEAMACGAVPICSTAGSLPEVVGEGGVLLPHANPTELADALITLVSNTGSRLELAAASRRQALTFDRPHHIGRLGSILRAAGVKVPPA